MKWIELATYKKEVPSAEKLALYSFDGENEYWGEGYLVRIEYQGLSKIYIFKDGDDELTHVTHFIIIEPPKPKE